MHVKVLQLYLFKTLWTAGSSVHGILQARPPPDDLPTQGSKPHLLRLLHWRILYR